MAEINFDRAKLSNEEVKFIGTFLRFEFALKESRYCPEYGKAQVDWGCVAKELGAKFYTRIRDSKRAETIVRRPPKKQILSRHKLDWEPQNAPENVDQLLQAIRTVRNNLLHGGKSGDPDNDPQDPNRNKKLISEAQWIIEQALHHMAEVRNHFEGP